MHSRRLLAMVLALALVSGACTTPSTPAASPAAGGATTPVATVIAAAPVAAAPTAAATPTVAPTATAVATPTPQPTPTPAAATSALEGKTWLTIYGRAFQVGPILGRLANYKNLDDMAAEVDPWIAEIKKSNGGKDVVPVIHLIYAMAIPCEDDDPCLLYLDTAGEDIINDYIKPALARGWQVILDTQTGRSTPELEVERMIKRGYMDFPNVHVAIDPEFHVHPGEDLPGIPIGQLEASSINNVQQRLDEFVAEKKLPTKKVVMVHQFGDSNVNDGNPDMVLNKKSIKTYKNVEVVWDADGFGRPPIKTRKYNLITDPEAYPFIKFRAIKLFFFNPHEERHHGDSPVMTWPQVFGQEEVSEDLKIRYMPDVVVIA
ncbi:MAG: hypothetical protein ACYC4L_00725 [Chloroflexota bacterium]